MKKNIAIVTGGDSSEEVISVQSAEYIINSIDKEKYDTYLVYIKKGKWVVKLNSKEQVAIDKNGFCFNYNNQFVKFHGAYLIIHGPPAENGKLQAYFDMEGIPYIGPAVLQASLTFNKDVCKQYLTTIGINSSPAILIKNINDVDFETIEKEIGYPCFVKPNEAGSSFGVTKVYEKSQLDKALKDAFMEDSSVLIEKLITGIEVTCGAYRLNGKTEVLPVTEIVSKKEFFDFEAKYTPGAADEITPARISGKLTLKCQDLTGKIYDHLNLTGISRIDYIIENDVFYLLEVNTIPGMSPGSIIPQQLKAAKKNVTQVITGLIDEAVGSDAT